MAVTGILGTVAFQSSSALVMTFRNLKIKRSAKYASHEVLLRKPVLEFTGQDSTEVTFSVQLDASLGLPPHLMLAQFKRMVASGIAYRLILGAEYMGKFVIESVDEDRRFHNRYGICQMAEVSLTLKEA